jgi:iron complex transport system substrate-binding protein
MRKRWLTLFALASLTLTAVGCGSQPAAPAQTPAAAQTDKPAAKDPKIASMSIHLTNHLLALGVKPVGSVIGGDVKDFLPHVKDRLAGVQKLGVVTDPDMEAVLALKPDTILIDEKYSAADKAKYEKIAKTESFNLDDGTWRDTLKKVAKLLSKDAQAEAFIKDYDAEAERIRKLMADKLGPDAKAMAIRVTAKELRVMGMQRPVGPLMFDDLKLKPAKGVEKINKAYEVISQEVLPDFDADAIFVIVNKDGEAEKVFKQLEANPLWLGLKAVKNKHVYVVEGNPWLDYSSLGHKLALDNVEKLMKP